VRGTPQGRLAGVAASRSGQTLISLVGCGSRLNDERTLSLGPTEEKTLTIDAASKDQTITIQVNSTGSPVNVYCYLEKDEAEAEKAIQARQASDKILAKQEKTEGASLKATIPAKNKAVVMLTSATAKSATVKVKITN
jgi:hypothetical protein